MKRMKLTLFVLGCLLSSCVSLPTKDSASAEYTRIENQRLLDISGATTSVVNQLIDTIGKSLSNIISNAGQTA
jgi:hypothetical protein